MKYKRETEEGIAGYMKTATKTKNTVCPLCSRARNVYHIIPWDYRKVCTNCDITWQEDNY